MKMAVCDPQPNGKHIMLNGSLKRLNGEAKNGIHFIQSLFDILSVKSFGYEIPRNNSQFRIRRNTHHGNWDLYLKYESEDFFLSTFSNSIILKLLAESSTPFHLIDLVIDISAGELKPRCILTNNSVETFDGVNFNYELSNCWTLASQTKNFHQHNVFLIRKPQGQSSIPDFKYFMFDSGTVIEFSNNELKIVRR
ncbi:hypothetical protein Avbf_14437 [Armadillidium vulgare]|nr:hypothetical protein Avbf_14437 [Armadillidium vulgare]